MAGGRCDARSCTAAPHNQRRLHYEQRRQQGGSVDSAYGCRDCPPSHLLGVLPCAGQVDRGQLGKTTVIKARQRDLVGNGHAGTTEDLHEPDRLLIIPGHHGGRQLRCAPSAHAQPLRRLLRKIGTPDIHDVRLDLRLRYSRRYPRNRRAAGGIDSQWT